MPEWDSIYRSLKNKKIKYKTFGTKIDSRFIAFATKQDFPKKTALDIGCGEGKYTKYLAEDGYAVDAIDASPEAVKMTKAITKNQKVNVKIANMFKWQFPDKKYGLVISIAVVGHGYKNEIVKLIEKIYSSLLPNGKVFITLFDTDQAKAKGKLTTYKKIVSDTYAPRFGREKGVPHSFFNKKQALELFSKFKNIKIYSGGDCALYITATKEVLSKTKYTLK